MCLIVLCMFFFVLRFPTSLCCYNMELEQHWLSAFFASLSCCLGSILLGSAACSLLCSTCLYSHTPSRLVGFTRSVPLVSQSHPSHFLFMYTLQLSPFRALHPFTIVRDLFKFFCSSVFSTEVLWPPVFLMCLLRPIWQI